MDVAPGYNASTGDLTVELWYRANVSGTTQVLLVKGLTGGVSGYELLLNGGKLAWDLQGTGGTAFNTTTPEPANNVWHHVAGVLDRSTHTAILYVDGVEVASQSANVGDINTAFNLGFGALTRQPGGTPAQFFNGLIAEVSIYNRALGDAEIQSIFDAGSAGKIKDTPYISAVISLSDGVVDKAYTPQSLAVVLGTPPYSVSIDSGALPLGLSIASSGIISGTPTTAGEATFTLQISDSKGKSMISDPINIVVVPVGTIRLWDAVPRFNSGLTTSPAQAVVLAARSVTLDFKAGDFALLSSTPDGMGSILADNFIAINGVNICAGSPGAGCFTGIFGLTPVSPIDVSSAIPIDENLVLFEWKDYGGVAATSDIFLVTSAKISE